MHTIVVENAEHERLRRNVCQLGRQRARQRVARQVHIRQRVEATHVAGVRGPRHSLTPAPVQQGKSAALRRLRNQTQPPRTTPAVCCPPASCSTRSASSACAARAAPPAACRPGPASSAPASARPRQHIPVKTSTSATAHLQTRRPRSSCPRPPSSCRPSTSCCSAQGSRTACTAASRCASSAAACRWDPALLRSCAA